MLLRPYGPRPRRRRVFFASGDMIRYVWLSLLFMLGYLSAVVWEQRIPAVGGGPEFLLYRHDTGETVLIDLETYVLGVVAAEMPATFHMEALKAQAVAARTYALYLLRRGQPLPDAGGAVLTTDHRSAQAWISQEAFWQRWDPEEATVRWRRIAEAVDGTRGQVLTYNGEPILAAYHSSSGGHTESAENYWSGGAPYLQAVPDPFDAVSPHNSQTLSLSVAALYSRVGAALPVTAGEAVVSVVSRYPSGRVELVQVGDRLLTGRQLREALGLRSSLFRIETDGETVTIIQDGYGHGIGMPQYGAEGMARQGYTYEQILGYYYTGVALTHWYD